MESPEHVLVILPRESFTIGLVSPFEKDIISTHSSQEQVTGRAFSFVHLYKKDLNKCQIKRFVRLRERSYLKATGHVVRNRMHSICFSQQIQVPSSADAS